MLSELAQRQQKEINQLSKKYNKQTISNALNNDMSEEKFEIRDGFFLSS